ncbi:hypothetical protein HHK36_020348 [Tetracentron sinense]|uniref:F-box domain-containing protein n=1 Tax=Tetracentron sinense TaxID=13715 RepID=A0A835DAW9_TETSI|nr:hypothetical protein HHK36_020348 [Tetracentron sinense]
MEMKKREKALEREREMEKGSTVDFNVLPEGCISNILSLTSPGDACRSSLVSSIFRWASESDIVWEKFLPSDYKDIISRSFSPSPVVFSSKKELYSRLCNTPILIDEGNKSFGLEKRSGKKCYMIGARELSIVWGDTPMFSEVAELINVCWLEIHGKMETRILSPKTTYAAYLVFKFSDDTVYGLGFHPAEVSIRFIQGGDEGGGETRAVYLAPDGTQRRQYRIVPRSIGRISRSISHRLRLPASTSREREGQRPKERGDGWMEIEMGEFFNDRGEDGEVEMSLKEVKSGHWKSGLVIQGIELRPR